MTPTFINRPLLRRFNAMATTKHTQHPRPESDTETSYRHCLIKPMTDADGPTRAHVMDALLVGVVAFTAVVLVDVLPALFLGRPRFLSLAEILARIPTAAVAFLLAFAAQWSRARGVNALAFVRNVFAE